MDGSFVVILEPQITPLAQEFAEDTQLQSTLQSTLTSASREPEPGGFERQPRGAVRRGRQWEHGTRVLGPDDSRNEVCEK